MKFFGSLLIGLLLSLSAFAQEPWEVDNQSKFTDRVVFGGNIGASFGTITFIDLSPRIGYRATNRWLVGFGGSYRYRKDTRYTPDLKTTDWSLNVFTRYAVYGPIFLHAEYEYLNYEFPIGVNQTGDLILERTNANSMLVGGGLAQPLGSKAVFLITVLYNLSHKNEQFYPYAEPFIFRVGFGIGL